VLTNVGRFGDTVIERELPVYLVKSRFGFVSWNLSEQKICSLPPMFWHHFIQEEIQQVNDRITPCFVLIDARNSPMEVNSMVPS
jgi:hypothetical protein